MSYKAYFLIEKQIKRTDKSIERSDLIYTFTNGKKRSLKALSTVEYRGFISWLEQTYKPADTSWQQTPENRMRRKIYSLFVKQMHYTKEQMANWCVQYGKFHKPLTDHTRTELTELVTQAETVYNSYLSELTKRN